MDAELSLRYWASHYNLFQLSGVFFIVWEVLIHVEPTLGYATLRAIQAHHGESYLRRDISTYDGLRKPTRYGGLRGLVF